MEKKKNTAPEIPRRTAQEESNIRCHAGGEVVKKWLISLTCTEACQKLKVVESVLETLQENGIDTVEAALESVRLAGSISMYTCKDGIFAERAVRRWLEEYERSNGANS